MGGAGAGGDAGDLPAAAGSRQSLPHRLCTAARLSLPPSALLRPACRSLQDLICVCPKVVEKKKVPVVSAVPAPVASKAKAGAAAGATAYGGK